MSLSSLKMSAVALMCLTLAACTGGAPAGSSGEEATGAAAKSVRYLVELPEDPATLKMLDKHLEDFEKSSGIKVELDAMPQDSMRTVLQTQLRSGEGPDVFNWGSGPGFAGALANAGLLYDLTDAYEKYGWEVYDFAKERVTFDGKTYGIPGEMETIGLFYNEDLLEKEGIAPPQDVTELRTAADKLRGAGITPIAASDKEGWQGGHLLSMALSSEVGSEGMQQLIDGDKPWDSPEVVRALRLWEDLNKSGNLTKSPTSVSYDSGNAMFFSGKAAMNPTGSWHVTELDTNVDFKVGYMPFPGPDGPGIFTGGLGSGPFISAGTTKEAAALELMDFLASPEHAQWPVENFKTIPPSPVDTEDVKVSPLFSRVLEDATKLSDGTADFGYNIDVLMSDVFNEAMYDGMQGILSGQSSAEEVAKSLQAASKK